MSKLPQSTVLEGRLVPRVSSAQDPLTRLRFALMTYGSHIDPCPGRPCGCGFLGEWQAAGLPATVGDALDIAQLAKKPETLGQAPGTDPVHNYSTATDMLCTRCGSNKVYVFCLDKARITEACEFYGLNTQERAERPGILIQCCLDCGSQADNLVPTPDLKTVVA